MNEVTTLLKVGTADLVLRMIEAGVVMRDLTLENPIRAIREVSHDITGRRKVRLANGKEVSALEIQQEYLRQGDRVRRAARRRPDRQAGASSCGAGCCDAVETGDLEPVDREIDWVTKLRLIERYQRKHDLPLSHPRVAQLDLAYHDIRRGRGLYACWSGAARSTGSPPTWRSSRRRRPRRRPPGPGCAASSSGTPRRSAATSPSTGCTSSSTTRRSAPCCARTRSGPYDERVERLIASM